MNSQEEKLSPVLSLYGIRYDAATISSYGKGLINGTWRVKDGKSDYILQEINQSVFRKPHDIAHNIRLLSDYLHQNLPHYLFIAPIASLKGSDVVTSAAGGVFRLFPFVAGSYTHDVVHTSEEAYEAALQFGRFTASLHSFDAGRLKTTIPNFHDLQLRYNQFQQALSAATPTRLGAAKDLVENVLAHSAIVSDYVSLQNDPHFKTRVAHHDTKISNVLFNRDNKGICVIDLDTVMPGYFISDVGDMMRTYLSPVSEEEKDFNKIEVRDDFYTAIVEGYKEEMEVHLTKKEKSYFFYAGKFMIYMQGLRFLTDYLNDDVYYGAAYEGHNLLRAGNQLCLLERFMEKASLFVGK